MKEFGLNGPTVYDPSINSAFAQEMTSGGFRAVHNIIPGKFKWVSRYFDGEPTQNAFHSSVRFQIYGRELFNRRRSGTLAAVTPTGSARGKFR